MGRKLGESIGVDPRQAAAIVEELHLAQRGQVGALRAAAVLRVQVAVVVRPANSVDRDLVVTQGTTHELSAAGVTAVLARPIAVGSFFQIAFDLARIDLAPALVRCELCSVRGEDEFEARLTFLRPVVIPELGSGGPG